MYCIYVRLSGGGFNPKQFHEQHGAAIGGGLGFVKSSTAHGIVESLSHWKSRIIRVASVEDTNSSLIELLEELRLLLERNAREVSCNFEAVIVHEIAHYEDARGIYLSRELVSILADMDADIDYDLSLIL